MKHTISVLVENRFGVLARVAGLFSSRGYNIQSLSVGETEDPQISRMTIVVDGDESILEQINKQLNKLIDVIKVLDLTVEDCIERELMLMRVTVTAQNRSEIMELVNVFRAKIVDISHNSVTVEVSGSSHKVDALLDLVRPYGIKEMVRTGKTVLKRSPKNKPSQTNKEE
jgi:acetolactate synthase I/III small subunit